MSPRETAPLTVLCCRSDGGAEGGGSGGSSGSGGSGSDSSDVAAILQRCADLPVHLVGRRPKKAIDPLLAGRILVVGDDSDLAAVVLRLLRKDLLGAVEVAYASPKPTPMTELYSLPVGAEAVVAAQHAEVDLVPLVRSDAGGVLLAAGELGPVTGTVYVDEKRVLSGSAPVVHVEPDPERGLAVSVRRRRILGFGRRAVTTLGRAVEFGLATETRIVSDGVIHPRRTERWVYYKHTEPLRLVRGVY